MSGCLSSVFAASNNEWNVAVDVPRFLLTVSHYWGVAA